jgi:hypothetical protein
MPTLPLADQPHIVILGAGASIAAYNDWGAIGDRLPSMQNIVDILALLEAISQAGYDPDKIGFEDLYDELASSGKHPGLRELIENQVNSYFSSLSLPDSPTIYDYLILGLREKDIIATFNWDPFLLQAYMRNEIVTKTRRPQIAFLHGNVLVGVCEDDRTSGIKGRSCSECGKTFTPSKLLYPVRKKDYSGDGFIKNEWDRLRHALNFGYYLTIFGYSAPKTDVEARKLMLDAWEKSSALELAEVDIIDIKPRQQLEQTWEEFFFKRRHYAIQDDIRKSYLFRHPRRSCDAFAAATLMLNPWHDNPFPRFDSLGKLQQWVKPLIEEEEHHSRDGAAFSGDPLPPNEKTV